MRARIAFAAVGMSLLWAGAASACAPALHLAADHASEGDLLGYGITCTPGGSHFWVFADRDKVAEGETGPDGVLGRFVVPDLGAAHTATVGVYVSSAALPGGHAVDSLPLRYAPGAADPPVAPPASPPTVAPAPPASPPAAAPAPPARSGVLGARAGHPARTASPHPPARRAHPRAGHRRRARTAVALRRARTRIRLLSKRLRKLANYLVKSGKTPAARAAKRVAEQAAARERALARARARARRARKVAPRSRSVLVPPSHHASPGGAGSPLVLLLLAAPALLLVLLAAVAGRRRRGVQAPP